MANGNRSPVSTTRKSEMPSIPANHWMPRLLIHVAWEINWKSELVSNAVRIQIDIAPTIPEKRVATNLCKPLRADGVKATAKAPIIGRITNAGMVGKEGSVDAREEAKKVDPIRNSSL